MNKDYDKLLQYALRILVNKRYTSHEMDTKLRAYSEKRSLDSGEIKRVISRLVELKYINDMQFINDYISDRFQFKPRGLRLIRQELMKKGLSNDMMDKCLHDTYGEDGIDEADMATRLLEKKQNIFSKVDGIKRKQKIFTFLYSKGFMGDSIYKAMDNCYDACDLRDLF